MIFNKGVIICFADLISRKKQEYLRDGVLLSESGMLLIKSLEIEKEKRQMSDPKKKRFNRKMLAQMEPVVLPSKADSDAMELEANGSKDSFFHIVILTILRSDIYKFNALFIFHLSFIIF